VDERTAALHHAQAQLQRAMIAHQHAVEHVQQAEQAVCRAREQLRQLTTDLHQAQEHERAPLARDTAPQQASPAVIRVLVADDHATVRAGIRRFLAETPDLVVVREARTAAEIFAALAAGACEVVLLDIGLPGRDGLDVLKELQQCYPTVPVLMFSVYAEEQYAVRALKTGAAGYVTKNSEPEVLLTALRKVAQGGRYISAALGERLAVAIATPTDQPLHATLANREYQVLLLLGEGKTVTDIGNLLALSVKTISTYRTRILHKLHLKTTADLIRYVLAQQLLPQPTAAAPSV
jgi:DNA-binding NarL/FixJ family response regulator